eukprot:scaffold59563_cov30-Tisochrysis_lutea.AAC.4
MHLVQARLDGGARRSDVCRILGVEIGREDSWEDVLFHHVNHGSRLHLNEARVVVEKDLCARLALLLVEDSELLEKGDVLRVGKAEDGLDTRVDAPDATLLSLDGPGLVVAVAVEDHAPVLVESLRCDVNGRLASLDLVGKVRKRIGPDGAEHSVDERDVLR